MGIHALVRGSQNVSFECSISGPTYGGRVGFVEVGVSFREGQAVEGHVQTCPVTQFLMLEGFWKP